MAITVVEKPQPLTVKGQKLMYTCTSTNSGQTGFKYVVVVKDESATEIGKYYVAKNPADTLIFDLRQTIDHLIKVDTVDSQQSDAIIHNMPHAANQQFTVANTGCQKFTVEFGEVYGSPLVEYLALQTATIYLTDGRLEVKDGYKNAMAEYDSESTSDKGFLLDREAEYNRLSGLTGVVIETNNTEYGVVAFRWDSTALFPSTADKYQYAIYDANGIVIAAVQGLVTSSQGGEIPSSTTGEDKMLYGAFYPANLSSSDSVLASAFRPTTVTDWLYYTVELYDDSAGAAVSAPLIFVNTCTTSKHDSAQLAWTNSVGGWEYLTFDGRVKHEVKGRSKDYTKTVGSYGGTAFSFDTFDRQTTPFYIDSELMYTLTKIHASDIDTRLLEPLAKSKNVMVSLSSGVWLPVTVEGASFEMQPTKQSKGHMISVKIKLSQTQEC